MKVEKMDIELSHTMIVLICYGLAVFTFLLGTGILCLLTKWHRIRDFYSYAPEWRSRPLSSSVRSSGNQDATSILTGVPSWYFVSCRLRELDSISDLTSIFLSVEYDGLSEQWRNENFKSGYKKWETNIKQPAYPGYKYLS